MIHEKIPVNVISGFLGAGKTTAIINLLGQKNSDEQWAIVVNEFGKVNIDGKTLQSAQEGEVYEITGGCICCTAKTYLNDSLQKIIQSKKYSRIIIEPTGLGGIEMVTEIVDANPELYLKLVICLVDILMVRNPIKLTIPIFKRQILNADAILFSKIDLLSNDLEKAQLMDIFKSTFPLANIIEPAKLDISILELENIEVIQQSNLFSLVEPRLLADNYSQKICTFDTESVFDMDKFTEILRQQTSILRAKGTIRTSKGWKFLNYTLTGCTFESRTEGSKNEFVIIAEKSEQKMIENIERELTIAIY